MASSRSPYVWPIITVVGGLILLTIALPTSMKPWAPAFLRTPDFQVGLDLAGGTQLDFRISEEEMKQQLEGVNARLKELQGNVGSTEEINSLMVEKQAIEVQQENLVEAIRTVLEKRINSLGVSEATITPSYLGGEKHLLVECPGVVDVQKCIATVGKTIQLEFKEEFTEASVEYERGIRAKVDAAQVRMRLSGATLQVLGQDLGTQLGISYGESTTIFRDQLPKGLEDIWNARVGTVLRRDVTVPTTTMDDQGQPVATDIKGIMLAEVVTARTSTGRLVQEAPTAFKLYEKTEQGLSYTLHQDKPLDASLPAPVVSAIKQMKPGDLRAVGMEDGTAKMLFLRLFTPGQEEARASHILVSYKGASQAEPTVSRTKEQALARAQDLKKQLDGGANFAALATAQSDGPSKSNGGSIGAVTRGAGLVPSYEQFLFSSQTGKISEPLETPFGYFLVRVDEAAHTTTDKANFDVLTVTGQNALTRANDLIGKMQRGEVTQQDEAITLRTLFFSLAPTGWKDTELDGTHFRSASVQLDPTTNRPVVQILFDSEGGKMFQELTKNNVGKRIAIFVGGELVSAPTVNGEITGGSAVITGSANIQEAQTLAQDLNTGAIPAPIYLSGQRTVEATLGEEAVATSVKAALYGLLVLILFLIVIYRFLGVLASIALIVYAIIFIALLKLPLFLVSSQKIVLTLAGTAGMILSIGMAVDTNVLVYERIKEELRKGKMLKTAVETGFVRAWPSIRDSNISTLITCVVLFFIGTSIVRGFAITLGIGVLISMFTGMVIIRWIARRLAVTKFAQNHKLFPGMQPAAVTHHQA